MYKLKLCIKQCVDLILDYRSYRILKVQKRKRYENKEEIKVLFICQMPQLWDKLSGIYEAMLESEIFSPYILAVPENVYDRSSNVCYEYFSKKYDHVIDSIENGNWHNISKGVYDYIFYQRPYDSKLPKNYRSSQLMKKGKICYLAYGYLLSKTNEELCMDKAFFRNVYLYFAENEYVKTYNQKRFPKTHSEEVRKTVYTGYPALMGMQVEHSNVSNIKDKKNEKTVIWTPRWTTNKKVGNSNFFKYKENMLHFFIGRENTKLIFRPHPLMFDNFIKTGEMRRDEVEKLKNIFYTTSNLKLDMEANYFKEFWESDLLITDISSIIIEYLITGKPIIYCETDIEPNDFMNEILSVCYRVQDWNELRNIMEELISGNDFLRADRERLAEKISGENDLGTVDRIVKIIRNDQ